MSAVPIKEMRHPHDAVLDFILANPFACLRDVANFTGYSVPWLSTMIRSDVFQAAYAERRGDIESGIMTPLRERLEAIAHLACDNLEEKLKTSTDPDFALDAFDKVLHRAGFAPNKVVTPVAGGQTNVNVAFVVQREELDALRGQLVQGAVVSSTTNSSHEQLPPPEPTVPSRPVPDSLAFLDDLLGA